MPSSPEKKGRRPIFESIFHLVYFFFCGGMRVCPCDRRHPKTSHTQWLDQIDGEFANKWSVREPECFSFGKPTFSLFHVDDSVFVASGAKSCLLERRGEIPFVQMNPPQSWRPRWLGWPSSSFYYIYIYERANTLPKNESKENVGTEYCF